MKYIVLLFVLSVTACMAPPKPHEETNLFCRQSGSTVNCVKY